MAKKLVFVLLIMLGLTFSMKSPSSHVHRRSSHHQQLPMVGGYSKIDDIQNLNDDQNQIDEYLRQNFQDISDWDLISAETQIVSGVNYKYTYANDDNKKIQFIVYDQPWTQTRQVMSVKKNQIKKNDKGELINSQRRIQTRNGPINQVVKDLLK